jgi:hypothetical protein
MANTANSIITPQNAILATSDLTAISACTTRAPTATAGLAAANIQLFIAANASGDQTISQITIKGASTSIIAPTVAQIVGIWRWDGTKAYLITEISIPAFTPSTTLPSTEVSTVFSNLSLAATQALYISTTVTTTAATTALVAIAYGAAMV